MSERLVFGSEIEYGCRIQADERFVPKFGDEDNEANNIQVTDNFMQYSLLHETIKGHQRIYPEGLYERRDFLSNGARMYLDLEHLEYATPECKSLDDFVAAELAGDKIMTSMLLGVCERNFARGFELYRRLLDPKGASWGYHINHQVKRDDVSFENSIAFNKEKFGLLGLHNATHVIYTGAGIVRGNEFWIAQKGSVTDVDYSEATVKYKPVVNLRNEPLASHNKYARIHGVSGDTTHSPWAIKMQAGTTSLVLRLGGAGHNAHTLKLLPEMELHKFMKVGSSDITMKQTVQFKNREAMRPLDVQYALYEACKQLPDLSDDDTWVLREWGKVLTDLDSNPTETYDRTNWAAKLQELKHRVPNHHEHSMVTDKGKLIYTDDITAVRAVGVDGNFDLVAKSVISKRTGKRIVAEGYGVSWRNNEWRKYAPDPAKIEQAITTPPADTRAAIRGRIILHLATKSNPDFREVSNWENVRFGTQNMNYGNPQDADHKIGDRIMKLLQEQPRRRNIGNFF